MKTGANFPGGITCLPKVLAHTWLHFILTTASWKGRQWPHLIAWKGETLKSSACTSKLSPQSPGLSLKRLLPATCWNVKACIPTRHGLRPHGVGVEGPHMTEQDTRYLSQPPGKQDRPLSALAQCPTQHLAHCQMHRTLINKQMDEYNKGVKSSSSREGSKRDRRKGVGNPHV